MEQAGHAAPGCRSELSGASATSWKQTWRACPVYQPFLRAWPLRPWWETLGGVCVLGGAVSAAEARPWESFVHNPGAWHPALTWSGWTRGTGGHPPEGPHTAAAVLLGRQLRQGIGTLEKKGPWALVTCFPLPHRDVPGEPES